MGDSTFAKRTFLIVDDHNFSRITVLRLLKNLGDPETYSATNGVEALSILEKKSRIIDCVIADFNMPVMHGLLLLKHIRTGRNEIRRNLPILMLTGHGDSALVELAIQLDVNSFMLKPVTKQTLTSRLQQIFDEYDPDDESHLKSEQEYEALDVDTRIRDLLEHNAASQIEDSSIVKEQEKPDIDNEGVAFVIVGEVPIGSVLARPIFNKEKTQMFLKQESVMDKKRLTMIRDLADMGMIDPLIPIVPT